MWKQRFMRLRPLRQLIKLLFAGSLVASLIGPGFMITAYAELPADADHGTESNKIHIRADKLVSQRESNYIHFMGDVKVDVDQTKINSSELKVFYEQMPSAGSSVANNNINKIVASGNVTIDFDNRSAKCDQAVYQTETQTLILTGEKVAVMSENNSITGDKITFNQKTGQITVDGTPEQRVNAVIHRVENNTATENENNNR